MQHQTSQIECGVGVAGDILDRGQTVPVGDFKNNPAGDGAGTDAPAMISANGEVDLGNVDLSQMDPEVIRVNYYPLKFPFSFCLIACTMSLTGRAQKGLHSVARPQDEDTTKR